MGGSPIENDSDQVILLDHSQYERLDDHALTVLLLAKNRHGSLTEIPVKMDFRCLRISEIQSGQNAADCVGSPPITYPLKDRERLGRQPRGATP